MCMLGGMLSSEEGVREMIWPTAVLDLDFQFWCDLKSIFLIKKRPWHESRADSVREG